MFYTRYNASEVQLDASCSLGKIGSKINVEEVELKVGNQSWLLLL